MCVSERVRVCLMSLNREGKTLGSTEVHFYQIVLHSPGLIRCFLQSVTVGVAA